MNNEEKVNLRINSLGVRYWRDGKQYDLKSGWRREKILNQIDAFFKEGIKNDPFYGIEDREGLDGATSKFLTSRYWKKLKEANSIKEDKDLLERLTKNDFVKMDIDRDMYYKVDYSKFNLSLDETFVLYVFSKKLKFKNEDYYIYIKGIFTRDGFIVRSFHFDKEKMGYK